MIASQSLPPLGFGYAPLAGLGIKLDETYPLIGCLHIPIKPTYVSHKIIRHDIIIPVKLS